MLSGKEQVSRQLWTFKESNTKLKSTFYVLFFLFESVPLKRLFPKVRYLGLGYVRKVTKNKQKIEIDWLFGKKWFNQRKVGFQVSVI